MQDLNFINNTNLKSYQDTLKWIKSSATIISILLIILSFISIREFNKLQLVRAEIEEKDIKIKTLNKWGETQKKLKSEKNILREQFIAFKKIKEAPKAEFALFLNIHKLIPKDTKLQSISITKQNLELSMTSNNEKSATTLVKKIANLRPVKSAKLASIQKNKDTCNFTIKGDLNK